ncbi:CIC11C00000003700 [Sungouiella intermedia]|uniref:CIC11C00000001794 n=1 Tax=Sungouiella intermedia TaxID=45354 RepID=A0A1L0C4T3_9ASCO|nr:CIC11C00000003700 [[Candida] intermedia]SGZ58531.1 CIC11C00000001794 [[Candida] intermedia]
MEYSTGYLDDEELSHLNQEQENGSVDEQQFDAHAAPPQDVPVQHGHPVVEEEELLAAQAAADAAVAQQQQQGQPGGVFSNVGQGLVGKNHDMMMQYWQETINSIEHDEHDFKNHQLPLARIKKVMKTDEDVRMISAEAPILFAKGCDVFITELTMRAWIHAEENKRRTLQKSDIAAALTKSDMFDFLIDVVPREEEKPKKPFPPQSRTGSYVNTPGQLHHLLHQQGMHAPPLRGPAHPAGAVQTPLGHQLPATQGLPMVSNIPGNSLAPIPQVEVKEEKHEKKEGEEEGYEFEGYSGYSNNY